MWQESSKVRIQPVISFPEVAEVDQAYLLTIDVHIEREDAIVWPYTEEEYPITCLLETGSLFKYTMAGAHEPVLLLHRFGRTYGSVRFLLTAAKEPCAGQIVITLVNEFGVPLDFIFLHCEVKASVRPDEQTPKISTSSGIPLSQTTPVVERPLTSVQQIIEEQLRLAGWEIQAYNPGQSYFDLQLERTTGVAVRDFSGTGDYLLFVQTESGPVGIIRVFPEGTALAGLERNMLVADLLDHSQTASGRASLPFVYLSTGHVTHFTNYGEPFARSRDVFTFHQPQTLAIWLPQIRPGRPIVENETLRALLRRTSVTQLMPFTAIQLEAALKLGQSLAENRPRTLVQIPSGRSRTLTIVEFIYVLLHYTNARRILYLVRSAERMTIVLQALKDRFSSKASSGQENYSVQRLDESNDPASAQVVVSDSETLNVSLPEELFTSAFVPSEIRYNPHFPIEMFDLIFVDGWPTELYERWNPLLNYFDAFLIGFSSRVDDTLLNIFRKNLVYKEPRSVHDKQGCWAITVGIDTYEDERFPHLESCVNDVMGFSRQLASSDFDGIHIRVLSAFSEPPTRLNIVTQLQKSADAAQPGDLLLFYFSGHGISRRDKGYLIAHNTRSAELEATAISLLQIKKIMESTRAKRKVIILDAYHANATNRYLAGTEPLSPELAHNIFFDAFEKEENIIILTACSQQQWSHVDRWDTKVQGVFTHFLLEALSGRADRDDKGYVTLTDTYKFVLHEVSSWANQHQVRQTPIMLSHQTSGEIILSRY